MLGIEHMRREISFGPLPRAVRIGSSRANMPVDASMIKETPESQTRHTLSNLSSQRFVNADNLIRHQLATWWWWHGKTTGALQIFDLFLVTKFQTQPAVGRAGRAVASTGFDEDWFLKNSMALGANTVVQKAWKRNTASSNATAVNAHMCLVQRALFCIDGKTTAGCRGGRQEPQSWLCSTNHRKAEARHNVPHSYGTVCGPADRPGASLRQVAANRIDRVKMPQQLMRTRTLAFHIEHKNDSVSATSDNCRLARVDAENFVRGGLRLG